MKQSIKKQIEEEAQRVSSRIKGGKIYGELIDLNDLNMILVAAYHIGLYDGLDRSKENFSDYMNKLMV